LCCSNFWSLRRLGSGWDRELEWSRWKAWLGLDCTITFFARSFEFILEGIVTTVIAFLSFWLIVDFPDDANFLDPLERYVVLSRLKEDGQASHRAEMFRWQNFLAAYRDWKLYVGIIIGSGIGGAVNAFSLFLPSIITELGFTATHAQLLTVPPYVLACIMVFCTF
jgi:hypothetical protein